jgi:glycosyltransferase involved in cell wall biosynthesis
VGVAPLVITVHGTDAALLERSALARGLARRTVRKAAIVTAVSQSAADLVCRNTGRAISADRIQPMPVETSWFGQRSTGGGGLVAVGRLTRQKRMNLALRALALLDLPELGLTVVGDGPERGSLEALAASLGLAGRVRFTGALPPPQVAAILAKADVALFPAVAEGFGLAAAEALMQGVPVVACRDGGGVLGIVPEVGAGRHADPSDASIARAVAELLADGGAREAARAEGTTWRARLDPATAAEVCERWYREALGA